MRVTSNVIYSNDEQHGFCKRKRKIFLVFIIIIIFIIIVNFMHSVHFTVADANGELFLKVLDFQCL
ncbi:CLUMA_CG002432, isoform A [Clunio marinus]|uniref:CLUMA_CG002432, isoform A n=1 Tax=Clunio marinus TaxID=568069 RepID=A0A1J1HKN7_9DIPT|nr:CLUMA_CG002432, isoform A [Clunio marinus]